MELALNTLDGADYPSRAARNSAITGLPRWRNKRAQPKTPHRH